MPRFEKAIPVTTALILALACRSDKPEDQAKKALSEAARALEAGDATGATEILAPDFRKEGPEGDLDRVQLRFLFMGLLRQGRPGITFLRVEGRVEGPVLRQEVDVLLSLAGERNRRRWLLTWRKVDGAWKVARAQAQE